MRRPTPLPPTAHPLADDGVTIARPDEELLAPVIPLTAPIKTIVEDDGVTPEDKDAGAGGAGGAGESGAAGEPSIGVRDVWRAARARRKALRAEVRRFTVRQRRRRMVWTGAAASRSDVPTTCTLSTPNSGL